MIWNDSPVDSNRGSSRRSILHGLDESPAFIYLCLHVSTIADTEYFSNGLFCGYYREMRKGHSVAPSIIPMET
jgi:hypothetical protein